MDKENVLYLQLNIIQPLKKNNEILPYATWMNLEDSMLREVSQAQKEILYDFTYMRNIK